MSRLMLSSETILQQLRFLAELDRLKLVIRQSLVSDRSRKENSAEHSWHLAMFALVFAEHASDVNLFHAVKMLLIHDIVEIDSGDTPLHSNGVDQAGVAESERNGAKRLFGLLPPDQGEEFLALWNEFEEAISPAAQFAKALDRLQPLLLNILTGGGTWTENKLTEEEVLERYGPTISAGAPTLWLEARTLIRRHFIEKTSPPVQGATSALSLPPERT